MEKSLDGFPSNDTNEVVHIFGMVCESAGKTQVVIADVKNNLVWTDNNHPSGTSLGVFPLNDTDRVHIRHSA